MTTAPVQPPPSSDTAAPSDGSETCELRVTGMHCASCVANVQKALEKQPGVAGARVNLQSERAVVTGSGLDAAALARAVHDHGYGAEPISGSSSASEMRSEIERRQQRNERLWRMRAIVGLSVWAPLEILHWATRGTHATWVDIIMLAGSTLVLIVAGGGFYKSAWSAARKLTTNMDTLIAIGATTAYVYSLVILLGRWLGAEWTQPLYFSEAAALLGLISLGHWLEARATAKAGSAVRDLLELQPDEAERLTDDGQTESIPTGDVMPGDRILIRPGGLLPVDGTIVEGDSELDESVVTGEPVPVYKTVDDHVVAGSINTTGRLVIEATVDGRHTTVSRIAEMVQEAQASKADIQRLADYVSSIFVPVVLSIAALTLLGWWIFGGVGGFEKGIISAVTVLIISCPCALGLATPMAVMVGSGSASTRGILVKSAGALEQLGKATHIIFDKTGTLTHGRPTVTRIEPRGDMSENELLALAASVEYPSEHPIARAIVIAAKERGLDGTGSAGVPPAEENAETPKRRNAVTGSAGVPPAAEAGETGTQLRPVQNFRAISGEGVSGEVDGKHIRVVSDEQATCRVEVNGETIGVIDVEDEIRDDARDAVSQLRASGLTVRMLTGDREHRAQQIGASLGFKPDEIIAGATPERKNQFVEELARAWGGVVMVGDGINDAAALAAADIGIALASGTNIAIESADVVIPGEHVTAVPETIELSRQTLRTIRQNLFFAFFYNACAIPIAAAGLLGTHGPIAAAAAMGFSDVTVIGNALRLKAKLGRSGDGSREPVDRNQ